MPARVRCRRIRRQHQNIHARCRGRIQCEGDVARRASGRGELRIRRADPREQAERRKLFFDLAFASAIADAGVALSTDYTPLGLLRFSVVFFLIWWAWVGHTFFSTWFDNDDLVHRLLTLAQVFLVAVMSVNTRTDMATREAAGFVAAYAGIRLLLAIQYSRVLAIGESRPFVLRQTVWIAAAAVTWIAAAVASPSTRLSVMGVAVLLELAGPFAARRAGGTVPADPAHLPERFGLFTLIMIGQSVVAITAGMRRQEQWTAPAAASALLGMLLAFSLWWAYFDSLGAAKAKPGRSRRHQQRMRAWAGVHLPLASAPNGSSGRPAVYGIRPEHFALADDGAEAEVQVVEPTGSEILVAAKLGGEDVIAVFRERHKFKPGDKIRLKPDPRLVHLFDESTGKRLSA